MEQAPPRGRRVLGAATRQRWKLIGVVVSTALLYLLCAYWIWARRDLLQASFRFPVELLWLPLTAGALVMALKPWRHQWLLASVAVSVSLSTALRDRLVMTTLKTFTPYVLGDPYGYLVVGRRAGLDLRQVAPLWLVDKGLTVTSVLGFGLFAALWWVGPPWLAVGASGATLALLLRWGVPWIHQVPRRYRVRLVLVSLAQESLQILALAALLAGVVDGGWGALCGYEVMLVHVAGMLPTLLGGAGSREAATLLVFSGRGDAQALFLAAFTATVALRVVPSLPGVLLYRRWVRSAGSAPAGDQKSGGRPS